MSRSFKIYTKTGDQGTSSLYNGERRPKTDALFEALGAVDELTSFLGIARSYCEASALALSSRSCAEAGLLNGLREQIAKVQATLQDLNAHIATPRTHTASNYKLDRTHFDSEGELTVELERWIDACDAQLPPLKVFILPVRCIDRDGNGIILLLLLLFSFRNNTRVAALQPLISTIVEH